MPHPNMLAESAESAESPARRGAPLQGADHTTAPKPRVLLLRSSTPRLLKGDAFSVRTFTISAFTICLFEKPTSN